MGGLSEDITGISCFYESVDYLHTIFAQSKHFLLYRYLNNNKAKHDHEFNNCDSGSGSVAKRRSVLVHYPGAPGISH